MTIEQFIDFLYGGVYWLIIGAVVLLALYTVYTSMEKGQ